MADERGIFFWQFLERHFVEHQSAPTKNILKGLETLILAAIIRVKIIYTGHLTVAFHYKIFTHI